MSEHVDEVYKELVNKVLTYGVKKEDRTGTGTTSLFGNQIEISMSEGFPLITTKRVFWRGVLRESIMFLKGITDLKYLLEDKVDIWTRDAYKKYLKENTDSEFTLAEFREFALEHGYDMGPIYGSQWIDFNGDGVNQLNNIINEIKTNPDSRRMKVYSANPSKSEKQTLPPCHDAFQLYIHDGTLDLLFQMRSSDLFHGLSFNIASYAFIANAMAEMTGLKVGRLIAQLGDTHIYNTHLDAVHEQIGRESLPLPQLKFNERVKTLTSISEIEYEDVELVGYQSHATIKAPQAF